jgi:hypothetical protein
MIGVVIIYISYHLQCVIAVPQPISGIPVGLRSQVLRIVQ